ncbi:MAG: starch-binding protein [Bacillota bacterium]|nr:starch-binding protein [Bacillota bacterium]
MVKKLVSVMLVLGLLCAMGCTAMLTSNAAATTATTPKLSGQTFTYYFEAPANWTSKGQTIACYYWAPIQTSSTGFDNKVGAWPGDPMTKVSNVPGHDDIWTCTLPIEVNVIIFNNLGNAVTAQNATDPKYTDSTYDHQTVNIKNTGNDPDNDIGYSADKDDVSYNSNYPNGLANFDNMIYVIPTSTSQSTNPYSGAVQEAGDWKYFNPTTGEISFDSSILKNVPTTAATTVATIAATDKSATDNTPVKTGDSAVAVIATVTLLVLVAGAVVFARKRVQE